MRKLIIVLTIVLISCTREGMNVHSCPFEHCPYKGLSRFNEVLPISDYTNYQLVRSIDSAHFVYPSYDYDQLDNLVNQ